LEDYLNKYPKSSNYTEVKQKLSNLYFQNGNIEFEKANYKKALNNYMQADKNFTSKEIQEKINLTEELILYENIKSQNNIADSPICNIVFAKTQSPHTHIIKQIVHQENSSK